VLARAIFDPAFKLRIDKKLTEQGAEDGRVCGEKVPRKSFAEVGETGERAVVAPERC